MEALDNPSYFTVPGGSKFSLLKRRGMGGAPLSPSGSMSPPTTPPGTSSTPASTTVTRRGNRTLLRSVSAQGDASLLVLGSPRICDLAPSQRPQTRRRASSSASDVLVSASPLSLDDDGEVFLSTNGEARYYNLGNNPATLPPTVGSGRRRHSIGAFLRSTTATTPTRESHPLVKPEEPKPAHSIRKRCERCAEKGGKCADVLDILVLSSGDSEAATLWVNYLTTCFQQLTKEQSRPPFKLVCIKLEDVLTGMTALAQHDRLSKARLQIVILCPIFLEHIAQSPGPSAVLGNLLQPGRVLAMLLGVTDDSVTIQHRAALLCYEQWRRLIVKDQDPTFVGDFMGVAMDILSRSWQLQQAINQIHKDENKAQFSLTPKKIKVGQNKLIVLLTDPLTSEDKIQIHIDKNGQRIEVTSFKKRNPYTLQFSMPATCLQVSVLASVFIEKNGKSLGHRLVKCESKMRELDQLLRSSDSPLQFMCQALGLSPGDKEQLDVFLVASLQRNLPPHFNLLQPAGQRCHYSCEEYPTLLHFAARFGLEKLSWQLLECPGGEQACQIRNACQLTPADMAERAGHTRLAHALKGFLQMTELSSMYSYLKGISEKQHAGFNGTNYLLPRPLNDTYLIPPSARPLVSPVTPPASISTSSQPTTPQYTNIESYQIPPSPVSLAESLDYHVPPVPLPVQSPLDNYQTPGQAIPYNPPTPPTPSSPVEALPHGGYLEMHSTSASAGSANNLRLNLNLKLTQHYYQNTKLGGKFELSDSTENIPSTQSTENHRNSSGSSGSNGSAKHLQLGAQDELVEIINDFKNNVFTISEVEKLVENWQNRHDVQQSFKEKQEQLNQMREEYERIQQKMKEHMKRPTPFERIRKFFSRGKSKNCNEDCLRQIKVTQTQAQTTSTVCHRPSSSLSLHSSCSSSSSGRMSTGSGTSLGDSGTHSDPEDRKFNEVARHELKTKMSAGRLYYEIPPLSSSAQDLFDYVIPGKCVQEMNKNILNRSNSVTQEDVIVEVDETTKCCNGSAEDQPLLASEEEETSKEIAVVEIHQPPTCKSDSTNENEMRCEKQEDAENLKTVCQVNDNNVNNNNNTNDNSDIKEKADSIEVDNAAAIHNTENNYTSKKEIELRITEDNDNNICASNVCTKEYVSTSKTLENSLEKENALKEVSYFNNESNKCMNNNNNSNDNDGSNNNNNGDNTETNSKADEGTSSEKVSDETDSEVLFDLPDYVNVSIHPPPPVPPRTTYSHAMSV